MFLLETDYKYEETRSKHIFLRLFWIQRQDGVQAMVHTKQSKGVSKENVDHEIYMYIELWLAGSQTSANENTFYMYI